MHIRTISRSDVADLLAILHSVGPHGHREWTTDSETSLLATLDNPRLDPDLGGWSIAYERDRPIGYSLVESELNIGRVIVGLAAMAGHNDALGGLLMDGVERAVAVADENRFEIHVAVRDTEASSVVDALETSDFTVVRTVLKMRVDVSDLELRDGEVPTGSKIRDADMADTGEAFVVTNLHNACFIGSWGFSPNMVEEIMGRAATDADRNGFPPIIVLEDEADGVLSAYNWITLSDGDGRVEMVGVHPSMRGRRLGWAIFNAGVKRLIDHGATTLSLDVDSENPPARRIYESAGYRTYSEVDYYGLEIVKS